MIKHGLFIFQITSDLIGNENRSEVLVEYYKQVTLVMTTRLTPTECDAIESSYIPLRWTLF